MDVYIHLRLFQQVLMPLSGLEGGVRPTTFESMNLTREIKPLTLVRTSGFCGSDFFRQ